MEMKTVESYIAKNDILHHGVEGQRWGITNGPPYPLDEAISNGSKLLDREKQKTIKNDTSTNNSKSYWEKASKLSDADLIKAVNRLNLEQQYSTMMTKKQNDINPVHMSKLKEFLRKEANKSINILADKAINAGANIIINALTEKIKNKK